MSNKSYNYGQHLVKNAGVMSTLGGLAGDFTNGVSDMWNDAKGLGNKAMGAIGKPINAVMDPIEKGIGNAWNSVKNTAKGVGNSLDGFKKDWQYNVDNITGPVSGGGMKKDFMSGYNSSKMGLGSGSGMGALAANKPLQPSMGGASFAKSPLAPSGGMAAGARMGGGAPKSPTSMSNNPSPGMSKKSAYRFGAHMVIKKAFEKESAVAPGLMDLMKGVRGVGTLTRDLGRATVALGRGSARGAIRGADAGSRLAGEALGSVGSKRTRLAGHGIGGLVGGTVGATTGAVAQGPKAFYDVLMKNKSIGEAVGPLASQSPKWPGIGAGASEAEKVVGKIGKNTALAGLGIAGGTTIADLIYNYNRYIPMPQPRRGYTQVDPYEYRQSRN